MFSFQNKNPNKKQTQSSGSSQTVSTARFSMYNSAATPIFGQIKQEMYEDHKFTIPSKLETSERMQNTQKWIQKLVQNNQNEGMFGFADDSPGFDGKFIFAQDQSKQQENLFYGQYSFDDPPSFTGGLMDISNFNEEEDCDNFRNHIQHFSSQEEVTQEGEGVFQFEERDFSNFHSFGIYPFERENIKSIESRENPPKRRSRVEEFLEEEKKHIIYEVDSKLQYEGQTTQMFIGTQTITVSAQNVASQGSNAQQDQKESPQYNQLQESIIQELSRMDSDEWNEEKQSRQKDFQENFQTNSKHQNMTLQDTLTVMSSPHNQRPLNQSIIGKLLAFSDKKQQKYEQQQQKIQPLRTTKSLFLRERSKKHIPQTVFQDITKQNHNQTIPQRINYIASRLNKDQEKEKEKEKEKYNKNKNFQESKVFELTLSKLDQLSKQQNTPKMNRYRDLSIQKMWTPTREKIGDGEKMSLRKNNFLPITLSSKLESSTLTKIQQKEKAKNQQLNRVNQLGNSKKKYRLLQIKTKFPLNKRPEVIDQRQEYENEQKSANNNQFFSQNISFNNQLYTEPIQIHQSAAKATLFGRKSKKTVPNNFTQEFKILNKIPQQTKLTSKPTEEKPNNQLNLQNVQQTSFISKKDDDNESLKSNKTFNLKKRTLSFGSKKITPQQESLTKQDPKKNGFSGNQDQFNKFKPNINEKPTKNLSFLSKKSQRQNTLSQKSSKSSQIDEVKIDTKGFLDRVLNSNVNQRNNMKSNHTNDNKGKFGLNFKRLNRFSSLVPKQEAYKQTKQQKQKQQRAIVQKQVNRNKQSQIKTERETKFSTEIKKIEKKSEQVKEYEKVKQETMKMRRSSIQPQLESQSQLSPKQQKNKFVIPTFKFTKKTPPNKSLWNNRSVEKAQQFDDMSQRFSGYEQTLQKVSKKSLILTPCSTETKLKKRQNYLINKKSKNDDESFVNRLNQNRRSQESEFPTISSSRQSEFEKQIENLMECTEELKKRIQRKKKKQEQSNRRIRSLNVKVKVVFSEQNIRSILY